MLDATTIEEFKASLRGELIQPNDEAYDAARKVWNGMFDRKPAIILRCVGTSDVISAVDFARDKSLLISVRGGGHHVAGTAVCDDGMMIDLSLMRRVTVDKQNKIARVDGGALLGDVDYETQLHGLAVSA
ncbi:MAG: FAD-dependent oxidoreductase, partial [Deltaproteobacteria bacterium]